MNDHTSKFNNSYRSGSPYCLRRSAAKPTGQYVDRGVENVENSVRSIRRSTRNRSHLDSPSVENRSSFEVSSVEGDENVENVSVRRLRNRSRLDSSSIEKSSFNVLPVESGRKKRKRSVSMVAAADEEPPTKLINYYQFKSNDCVYIELLPTGASADEEIVKFIAYHPSSSTMIGNFTYPTNPTSKMTYKMAQLTGIEFGCQMMLSENELVKYSDIRVVLEQFMVFIESLKSDSILLVYENRFGLPFTPCILIRFLTRFELLERAQRKIAGFIDCGQLFGNAKNPFDLDEHLDELKTSLLTKHLFYRVEALSKYFHKNGRPPVESVRTFDEVKMEAAALYEERSEENESEKENENILDSLDKIAEEARTIQETKSYLTIDELRNLYLLQKLRYQWMNSRTHKPKKTFPRFEPKTKQETAAEKAAEKAAERPQRTKSSQNTGSEAVPDESILSENLQQPSA